MPRGRKDRGDMKIGTFEKKYGLPPGAMRSKKGRDTRLDRDKAQGSRLRVV